MPQIAQILETYASQIFWLLIVFGLIYFGIGRAMLPKIEATVDARSGQVAGDLAAAEAARREADATEEAWRARMATIRAEAQGKIAEAKARGTGATEGRVKAADQATAARLTEAEAALLAQKQAALTGIETAAAEATQAIVAKLAGVTVEPDEAARAVKEAMAHG